MISHSWGAGEPIVLVHGGSGSWRHWVLNIEALARNHLVVAPDLPGMGDSALMPPGGNVGDVARLVAKGAELLLGRHARYHLAGFSFGAVVAGHLAASFPNRVRKLTLVGASGLGLSRHPISYVKLKKKKGAARTEAHRVNLALLMFADPARIDELAVQIQAWNVDHVRMRSRDIMASPALRDALRQGIDCPLHVIYGERDAIAWPFLEERMDFFGTVGPDVEFTVIEGAGHWVAYEAAERFNAVLSGRMNAG